MTLLLPLALALSLRPPLASGTLMKTGDALARDDWQSLLPRARFQEAVHLPLLAGTAARAGGDVRHLALVAHEGSTALDAAAGICDGLAMTFNTSSGVGWRGDCIARMARRVRESRAHDAQHDERCARAWMERARRRSGGGGGGGWSTPPPPPPALARAPAATPPRRTLCTSGSRRTA